MISHVGVGVVHDRREQGDGRDPSGDKTANSFKCERARNVATLVPTHSVGHDVGSWSNPKPVLVDLADLSDMCRGPGTN